MFTESFSVISLVNILVLAFPKDELEYKNCVSWRNKAVKIHNNVILFEELSNI